MKPFRQYLLLVAAILIWLAIGYRVYNEFNKDVSTPKNQSKPQHKESRKTYAFKFNYRDPFLSKAKSERVTQVPTGRSSISTSPSIKKQVEILPWPEIQFLGVISKSEYKQILAMLKIGTNEYFAGLGETVENIEVRQIWNDSVRLVYGGSFKTIKK
jgi:type II secretory pathway component PulC